MEILGRRGLLARQESILEPFSTFLRSLISVLKTEGHGRIYSYLCIPITNIIIKLYPGTLELSHRFKLI